MKANGRIFAKCNGDYANRGELNIPCMTCYAGKRKTKKYAKQQPTESEGKSS